LADRHAEEGLPRRSDIRVNRSRQEQIPTDINRIQSSNDGRRTSPIRGGRIAGKREMMGEDDEGDQRSGLK
jgi:hypothetical protein